MNKNKASILDDSLISELSMLVVGLVRNCDSKLLDDVKRMRAALSGAKKLKWLLIESDSSDATINNLNLLRNADSDFNFFTLGNLRERMPLRTERLAYCRNKYVDEIRHNSVYDDTDYVVVSDFDGLNTRITKTAILSCWERNNWDVCSSNQDGPYYDIWTLRHKEWCPGDCWAQYEFLNKYSTDLEKNIFGSVHSKMIAIPADSDWIEVDSAFGGFAIYRKKVFYDASYVGLTDSGSEISEHVPFHMSLRQKHYRIYINPKMLNAAYTDHTEHLYEAKKISRLIAHKLRLVKNKIKQFFKLVFDKNLNFAKKTVRHSS